MSAVITIVTGTIDPARVDEVREAYEAAVKPGLPPGMEQTFLLQAAPGQVAIASIWARRDDLDAMLATGQEPLARRLIREAGGAPEPTFYDVVARQRG